MASIDSEKSSFVFDGDGRGDKGVMATAPSPSPSVPVLSAVEFDYPCERFVTIEFV